jgi:hypothetical protein
MWEIATIILPGTKVHTGMKKSIKSFTYVSTVKNEADSKVLFLFLPLNPPGGTY